MYLIASNFISPRKIRKRRKYVVSEANGAGNSLDRCVHYSRSHFSSVHAAVTKISPPPPAVSKRTSGQRSRLTTSDSGIVKDKDDIGSLNSEFRTTRISNGRRSNDIKEKSVYLSSSPSYGRLLPLPIVLCF